MQLLSALPVVQPSETRSKWANLRARSSNTSSQSLHVVDDVVKSRLQGEACDGSLNDEETTINACERELKARAALHKPPADAEDTAPWLPPRPDEKVEDVVAFFFKHAEAASAARKPLRFHMGEGRENAYGLICSKDLRSNPGRCSLIIARDVDRLRQLALDMRRFDLKVGTALKESAVYLEADCDVLVCCTEGLHKFSDWQFRIKVVEEESSQSGRAYTPEVKADISVHFVSPDGMKLAPKGRIGLNDILWGWDEMTPYSMLWKAIIRPPRAEYTEHDLGLSSFVYANHAYDREDIEIEGCQGHMLKCSHFFMRGGQAMKSLCVIYLHGNCSSRLEVLYVLPGLLTRGMSVFCLDTSGSGMSGGDYISLGFHEEKDVAAAVRHLREKRGATAVALWGRSMGAAAAIFRAEQDHELAACVFDSAFSDLKQVIKEYLDGMRVWVPSLVLEGLLDMCRSDVEERAGFDPFALCPLKAAPNARCPAVFAVATDDRFISPHHTMDLCSAWGGVGVLLKFTGGHAGRRPDWFLTEASEFLLGKLVAHSNRKPNMRTAPEGTPVASSADTVV